MRTGSDPRSFSADNEWKLRAELRELQWQLPLALQRVLLRCLGRRYDPYTEWHRQNRAIFAHIPRTAGTSVALATGTRKEHVPMSRYAAWNPTAFHNYFKFCFVRNPWDRLLSAFSTMNEAKTAVNWPSGTAWSRKHLDGYWNFESFVVALRDPMVRERIMTHSHFRRQLDWLTLPRCSEIQVDFLGHFESVDDDFAVVARRLGLRERLPIRNASAHRLYRDAYSQEMRDIVGTMYADDIAAFDYRF